MKSGGIYRTEELNYIDMNENLWLDVGQLRNKESLTREMSTMQLDTAAICGFSCGHCIWVPDDMLSCLQEDLGEF